MFLSGGSQLELTCNLQVAGPENSCTLQSRIMRRTVAATQTLSKQ
jgi:hypothetical protein